MLNRVGWWIVGNSEAIQATSGNTRALPPQSNSLADSATIYRLRALDSSCALRIAYRWAVSVCLSDDQDSFRQVEPLSPELHRRSFHPLQDHV